MKSLMPKISGFPDRKQRVFLGLVLLLGGIAIAVQEAVAQAPVARKLLALYKSSEGRTEEVNEIANFMQLVLNNLGLVVEYRDAESALPDPHAMQAYRGVVTYFVSGSMRGARRYRRWLSQVVQQDIKVVIFNNFGAYNEINRQPTARDIRETRSLFKQLGVKIPFRFVTESGIQIYFKEPHFFDFERQLSHVPVISDMQSISEQNRVLLKLKINDLENDALILGPWGALVQPDVDYWLDEESGRAQWYLNPFLFFIQALQLEDLPVAELNTLGGKRLAFIHIDGDGFRTISKINRWDLCSRLMQKRVFERYDLPFSASVIAADVDPALFGDAATLQTAREIFALPNVEPASHGYAHPFDWRTGRVAFDSIPGYRFSDSLEIDASMRFIQTMLLPPGKTNRLFFWTGMCNPTESQIRRVESQNWLHINGRAGFLDPKTPSITSFAPPYTQVGSRIRINSRISNEYEFTHHWQTPYETYRNIIKTLEFTGKYGPLTPANIYLHYYIMEFDESWTALKDVLKWSLHQDWAFVYTSDYVQMVQDFLKIRFWQETEDAWRIRNAGALRTVRFRNEPRDVDLNASKHVLGFHHQGEDLLVHLDAAREHRVVLTRQAARRVYLSTFNMRVDSLQLKNGGFDLWVRGYGKFRAELRHVPSNRYFRAVAESMTAPEGLSNARGPAGYFRSDDLGRLRFQMPVYNATRVRISEVPMWVYWKHKLRIAALIVLAFIAFAWYHRKENRTPALFPGGSGRRSKP